MLQQYLILPYFEANDFYVVEIPESNNKTVFGIIMPKKNIKNTYFPLNYSDYLIYTHVDLMFPTMSLQKTIQLNDIYTDIGIHSIFAPNFADISGISTNRLYINKIVSTVNIKINNNYKSIIPEYSTSTKYTKLHINHQFYFYVKHLATKNIIIDGYYT